MTFKPLTSLAVLALAVFGSGCAEAPTPANCDAYADKTRADLLADEKLGLDSAAGQSLLDYAVDQARKGCIEEMTKPEVECVLAGTSDCFDKHRPWYRKLRYDIEDALE